MRLVVAFCGAAGAAYAADQAAQPPNRDMNKAIAQQLVSEGVLVNAAPNVPADNPYTPSQMLILAPKYTAQIEISIEHAEDVRLMAYRSHDIIRMACVDDKIGQIKTLANLAATPMLMLRTFKDEPIVMRTQFDVISRAHDRVATLGAEVDACMGDNLDAVTAGKVDEERTPNTPDDPTRPGASELPIERPPEASPYN